MERRPPTRVVEEPKRSIVPLMAVAVVAAVVVSTAEHDRISDLSSTVTRRHDASQQQPTSQQTRGDLQTLFSADDYPAEAQRNGEEGTVQVALTVDTTGRVNECTVIRSSNHASLDDATCNILQRRARFTPARDAAGRLVPDRVVSPPVTWRLEG